MASPQEQQMAWQGEAQVLKRQVQRMLLEVILSRTMQRVVFSHFRKTCNYQRFDFFFRQEKKILVALCSVVLFLKFERIETRGAGGINKLRRTK